MVNRKLHPKDFFAKKEKERIVEAIRAAEKQTSAEIRVYLENGSKEDSMSRARKVFEKLGMTRTKHRNGVLIYFSPKDRVFVILGDRGIHDKVGQSFWREMMTKTESLFSKNDFTGGLETLIAQVGARLKEFFPHEARDINELPDEV